MINWEEDDCVVIKPRDPVAVLPGEDGVSIASWQNGDEVWIDIHRADIPAFLQAIRQAAGEGD